MLRILSAYVGVIIDSLVHTFEYENKGAMQANLLKFCCDISGERKQQYLISKIEEELGACLSFEAVSVLHFEDGKLFTLKKLRNDSNQLMICGFSELPLALGLTGKALREKQPVVSTRGSGDVHYDSKTDNLLKLKQLDNIMIVPLFVPRESGTVLVVKKEKLELVGALQLLNYLPGDITKANMVIHVIVVGKHRVGSRSSGEVHVQRSGVHKGLQYDDRTARKTKGSNEDYRGGKREDRTV